MALNAAEATSTGMPMAAKPKLNGINVPQKVLDETLEILGIEKEAFLSIAGGKKTTSMSDVVTDALKQWNRAWRERHERDGVAIAPKDKDERRRFVREVGMRNLRALADELELQAKEDDKK